jgi:hypothetical protein
MGNNVNTDIQRPLTSSLLLQLLRAASRRHPQLFPSTLPALPLPHEETALFLLRLVDLTLRSVVVLVHVALRLLDSPSQLVLLGAWKSTSSLLWLV